MGMDLDIDMNMDMDPWDVQGHGHEKDMSMYIPWVHVRLSCQGWTIQADLSRPICSGDLSLTDLSHLSRPGYIFQADLSKLPRLG